MNISLIDSHAHLDYDYECSVEEIIQEAKSHGVDYIISIAAEAPSLDKVKLFSELYKNVFCTSGLHPHETNSFDENLFNHIKKNAENPKCVAIGEIGLDYYYEHSDKKAQIHALRQQLNFAIECGKPVVIHMRDAEEDTLKELGDYTKEWNKKYKDRAPGVIHCFTGTKDFAEKALAMGFYISFSGIITFKNADSLREIAKDVVPLNRILVETDSPYLSPVPFRGKKNHPNRTLVVAEKVAEIKSISIEEVAKATKENTVELFRLSLS